MEETIIKHISAEDFLKIDKSGITLLDIREEYEVQIKPIDSAVNIPFSVLTKRLSEVDKNKPVYVMCSTGDLSKEITEILTDMGYDAYNIDGGYAAYKEKKETLPHRELDLRGVCCPGPVVRTAEALKDLAYGQRLYIVSDEAAFSSDIAVWCESTGNRLVSLENDGREIKAVIEKQPPRKPTDVRPNGKTFVLFSGDLDKTIAAFIMANAAASMGRQVTLFFTFWGLNILRRPEKVSVRKNIVEKMFGFMMPRGTKKLGLSRMNMGGMGAKMIRAVMKSKGVDSLEELIDSAKAQGVRIVACQMSMDIMGIHREELIDGVELGGAATFIGSGEQSDMSLFI
ncbi:MAG: DsrE/DsrF/DrsH-like family protein [Ruminococcus sp.]|uniref:DsrE/DsrF/DrsH-like family protein n=1 Tax=Ruminococcus sp. TaxID=41978 RepID=UPI0025D18B4E|nr:DsrE/DsrF/DrsH-like family protein [Ruminococcus sp.]MBO4865313.1 DsrE/DsrF/DrsH-like family protein [Ruminococcus sp.]